MLNSVQRQGSFGSPPIFGVGASLIMLFLLRELTNLGQHIHLEGLDSSALEKSVQSNRTLNKEFACDAHQTTCSLKIFLATVGTSPQQQRVVCHPFSSE